MKNWLYRMEFKYGRKAIPNLMLTVIIGMGLVFVGDLLNPVVHLQSYLSLSRDALFHGQVWRLFTFIFLPPNSNTLLIFISLYFYYWIGGSLERTWGSFRFNVYYLCGVIGAILACLVTGYADNSYLNLSLFFAFAALYPDMEVLLFFFLPVKVKWLALLDGALFVFMFIVGGWPTRVEILMSLANFLLFFGPDFCKRVLQDSRYWKARMQYRRNMRR